MANTFVFKTKDGKRTLATLSAQTLGRLGGQSTSEKKAEAARINGAKGGRPRK